MEKVIKSEINIFEDPLQCFFEDTTDILVTAADEDELAGTDGIIKEEDNYHFKTHHSPHKIDEFQDFDFIKIENVVSTNILGLCSE